MPSHPPSSTALGGAMLYSKAIGSPSFRRLLWPKRGWRRRWLCPCESALERESMRTLGARTGRRRRACPAPPPTPIPTSLESGGSTVQLVILSSSNDSGVLRWLAAAVLLWTARCMMCFACSKPAPSSGARRRPDVKTGQCLTSVPR